MTARDRRWATFLTLTLIVLEIAAGLWGLRTRHAAETTLRLAVCLSSAFWLAGAVFPLFWREKNHRAAVMNGVAAAFAMYAGLAAVNLSYPL